MLTPGKRTQVQGAVWGFAVVVWSLAVAGCSSSKPTTAVHVSARPAYARPATTAAKASGAEPQPPRSKASSTGAATTPTGGTTAIPPACDLLTPTVAAQILGVSGAALFRENGGGGGSQPSVCTYLSRESSQGEPQISLVTRHDDGSEFRFLKAASEKKARASHGRDFVMMVDTLGQEAYEASAPNGVYLVILKEGVLFLLIGTETESSHRHLGPAALAAARQFSL